MSLARKCEQCEFGDEEEQHENLDKISLYLFLLIDFVTVLCPTQIDKLPQILVW
jgi:hypothetical protein